MITIKGTVPGPMQKISLWDIPIGTTFTGLITDRTEHLLMVRGLFLRGQGWVARLDPTPAFPYKHHVGWSLSERDYKGLAHRNIHVISYRPVNITITAE